MDSFMTISGAVITILSFIYAVYENRRNAKLINYNREQAWEIYRQSSNVLGILQDAKKIESTNTKFKEYITRGETFALELVTNCIRMIKRFEKSLTPKLSKNGLKKVYYPTIRMQ